MNKRKEKLAKLSCRLFARDVTILNLVGQLALSFVGATRILLGFWKRVPLLLCLS